MPLTCPNCHIVQADENETCINCGQPLTPAAPDAPPSDPAPAQARRFSRRLPAAIAACLLLALAASALFVALRGPTRRAAFTAPTAAAPTAAAPAAAAPAAAEVAPPLPVPAVSPVPAPTAPTPKTPARTAAKTPAGMVPLTITLDSTREGRHVKVGEDVTLTALAHGRSATLTLFYRRGRGGKTMLSFVEGSLCSTTWTPAVPGRYEFTATALDDRQQAAASRRVEITVDAPAPPPVARNEPPQDRPAQVPPPEAAAPPAPRPPRRPPATATRDRDSAPALTYHVAAAKFPFLRNATVLSDALNRRGYPAVPEPMTDPHGKPVYVVVTGTYRHSKEARAAALALQRSGYPAYFYGSR